MRSIASDARYAIRRLISAPGFTIAAVLTLALGIGANSTIFTVVNAILLRPPAHVTAPERLVTLYTSDHSGPAYGTSSYPDYEVFREQTAVFDGVTLFMPRQIGIGDDVDILRTQAELVTQNYFAVLGVRLQQGRAFLPEEALPGSPPVAVISNPLWRTKFNADPRVIGIPVRVNGNPFTVVGVAPPGYTGAVRGLAIDVWVPIGSARHLGIADSDINVRGNRSAFVIARLSAGTTLAAAQTAMSVVAQRLHATYPDAWRDVSEKSRRITLVAEKDSRIPPQVRGPVLGFFALLFGTVALVLLVCCANVASLLLARATARTREIAIRLSLGATRQQLIRQLLVESVVLATFGAVVGVALASAATGIIASATIPIPVRIALDLSMDARVLFFTGIVTLGAGVLFGLVPALRASRPGLVAALKAEGASVGVGRQRLALQKILVVSQVAMSLLLLVGASLFLRSLNHAAAIDPGFRTDHLLVVDADPRPGVRDERNWGLLGLEMERRIAALPGVSAVSWTSAIPLAVGGSRRWVQLEGYERREGEDMEFHYAVVGPHLFETLEIPIVRGRAIDETDRAGAPGAAVVNESFARRFWPNGDALGKRITSGQEYEIVGIARDGKYLTLGEPARPYMYFPALQAPDGVQLMVRTAGEPRALIARVRREILAAAPTWQALNPRTMDDQIAASLLPQRVAAGALWLFGLVALLLAAVGLYGVIAYSVTTRTREIGVRIALGAQRGDVVRSVVRESLTLVALGALLGVPAAWATTRLISGFLLGVTSSDPLAYGVAIVVLAAVTLAASWLPARRASRVDPIVAFKA
ncbi:MAG: ABC transporter permease [Gemmatimonadaceae bacterium]